MLFVPWSVYIYTTYFEKEKTKNWAYFVQPNIYYLSPSLFIYTTLILKKKRKKGWAYLASPTGLIYFSFFYTSFFLFSP